MQLQVVKTFVETTKRNHKKIKKKTLEQFPRPSFFIDIYQRRKEYHVFKF